MKETHRKFNFIASIAAVVLFLLLFIGPGVADDTHADAIAQSQKVAETWLAGIDAGKYADSYEGFGALFKMEITSEKWTSSLQHARGPVGTLQTRILKISQYSELLPTGTKGPFVILQYQTDFSDLKTTETVTTVLDQDGQWRIAGYYIRPRA